MHFSVCYPVFPYTFYSIDFFCLAFPSRCLFSPLPSWYIIFTLPCVFVPLLYRYRGYFHFSSPLTEKKKKRERKTPVFFISIFFLYADILHLLPYPSFSFTTLAFFIYLFIFLPVDLFPFLLPRCRPSSIPSFFQSVLFFSLFFFFLPSFFSFPMATIFHSFFFSFFLRIDVLSSIFSFLLAFYLSLFFFLFFFFLSGGLLLFLSLRRLFSLFFLSVDLLPFSLSEFFLYFFVSPSAFSPHPSFSRRLSPILSFIAISFLSSFFPPGLLSPSSPPSPSALSFVPLSFYSRKLNGINASDFLSCI